MITGGVSFAVNETEEPGAMVSDGAIFELHDDAEDASTSTFEPTLQVLLLFDQSVRGLNVSAPVEYPGESALAVLPVFPSTL